MRVNKTLLHSVLNCCEISIALRGPNRDSECNGLTSPTIEPLVGYTFSLATQNHYCAANKRINALDTIS